MANLKGGFDGDLWFVTRSTAPKTEEIRENQHVNVAYADPDDGRFVSISGLASLVRDPKKVDELWSRRLRIWFPDGKKDPELALIRVRIDRAEVWDSKSATHDPPRRARRGPRPAARRPRGGSTRHGARRNRRARKADPAPLTARGDRGRWAGRATAAWGRRPRRSRSAGGARCGGRSPWSRRSRARLRG